MSTISKDLAEELVKRNGKSKSGSAGYCLVRYQNRTKYHLPGVDLYNPESKVNCFDYAVFRKKSDYEIFLNSDTVGGVDVLWGSKKFHKDQQTREEKELLEESYALIDAIDETDLEIKKPSRRERR